MLLAETICSVTRWSLVALHSRGIITLSCDASCRVVVMEELMAVIKIMLHMAPGLQTTVNSGHVKDRSRSLPKAVWRGLPIISWRNKKSFTCENYRACRTVIGLESLLFLLSIYGAFDVCRSSLGENRNGLIKT